MTLREKIISIVSAIENGNGFTNLGELEAVDALEALIHKQDKWRLA